jgi:hypothetical protein
MEDPGKAPTYRFMYLALVQHELRILLQNRMACVVILLTFATASFLRIDRNRQPTVPRDTCYVLYWQEEEFVEHLKRAARGAQTDRGLAIEVLPADNFSGEDGIIRYPPGSHSIQLRTREQSPGNQRDRVIIYWYSGADPAAMWPYIEWFQQAAFEHLDEGIGWEVQTKPLHQELVVLGRQTRMTLEAFRRPGPTDTALLWGLLFFSACHLPKLSLAESVAGKMIVSLAVTPAGIKGVVRAQGIFYGILTLGLSAGIAAILNPAALLNAAFWLTVACAVVLYLGVALVIGFWSRSVASASVGTIVYFLASAVAYVILNRLTGPSAGLSAASFIAEAGLIDALTHVWEGEKIANSLPRLIGPAAWAVIWQVAGRISLRRIHTV